MGLNLWKARGRGGDAVLHDRGDNHRGQIGAAGGGCRGGGAVTEMLRARLRQYGVRVGLPKGGHRVDTE